MSFFSSDSFYILSKLCSFVKNFFIFLFHFVDHFRVFLSDSLFRLSHPNRFVNNFFIFSNSFDFPNYSDCFNHLKPGFLFHPQLFRLRVSAWILFHPYFSVVFSAVPQRLSYNTILNWNCQCFFYYLYISDNLYNFSFSTSLLFCFSYFFYYFLNYFLLYRFNRFYFPL